MEYTDEELARRVQHGGESALSVLMRRYTSKLMRYGRRFFSSTDTVVDLVQDIFVSAYEHINDFDSTRRFSPWIYRIAHNAFVDALRKRSKEPIYLMDFDRFAPHAVSEDPAQKEKESEEMRVLLEESLDKLPAHYREIIDLYFFEDFSYREIADILRVPIGTVGIRLLRAKRALKKLIPTRTL